ncbi:MAG TPA: hypothetical protein VGH06_04015 [Candidatus Udaeobacter sp.]|jgi:hypothetical protein
MSLLRIIIRAKLMGDPLLGAFCPFLNGIVVQLLTGIFQFARVILLRPD